MEETAESALACSPAEASSQLTPEWLTSRAFVFRAGPKQQMVAATVRFERNGGISGYDHPNEAAWRIEDGRLVVLRADGVPSCILSARGKADGTVSLVGAFLLAPGEHVHSFNEIRTEWGRPDASPRLTPAWLTSRRFVFRVGLENSFIVCLLRFEPSGGIVSDPFSDEVAWRIEDGKLVVLRSGGIPSCLASPTCNDDGTVTLIGSFLVVADDVVHRFDEVRTDWGRPDASSLLTPEWLTSRLFTFWAGPLQRLLAAALRFERNGRISGYRHSNETGWRIEDGRLVVLRADGVPSCIASATRNDDGTVSLIGAFLLVPGESVHRFDEIRTEDGLPEVFSFDLFDTLVARRCFEPTAIFRLVEAKSGVRDFARLRRAVESGLWASGDYTFDDIYAALGQATGWPAPTLATLRMLELAEEWDNLFPVREMVARVGADDMVVSDMYLPLSFLRRVVDEKCGLEGRAIHLSSHGKHHGSVWPKLLSTHRIRRHHGDHPWGDVGSAKQAGIDAEQVTVAAWTRGEQILNDAGLAAFALVVREARLRSFHPNPRLHRAQLAQFDINLPLLILASLEVLRRARQRGVDTLLMCSRDCNLWVTLMRWMAAHSAASPVVRYFASSRVLFLSDSPEYAAYFLRMRGQRSMLVDVSGTGRSPSHFIARIGGQAHASLFLIAATQSVANWVADLAPPRDDVDVTIVTEQTYDSRLAIETLNMSLEGRAMRLGFTGQSLDVLREPNEFGPCAQKVVSVMRNAFLSAVSLLRRSDIRQVPENIPAETLRSAIEALIGLANEYIDVLWPVRQDIVRAEGVIVAAARAERERNVLPGHMPRGGADAATQPGGAGDGKD